jgi:hypothetical protein
MIHVNQHFRECSFCGRKFPPEWEPLRWENRLYCSEKCVRFEANFPDASARPKRGREEQART